MLINTADMSISGIEGRRHLDAPRADAVDLTMDVVSLLLSGLYAMFLVVLSLVFCTSHYITSDVSEAMVDYYFVVLYLIASAWLCFRSCFQCKNTDERNDIKTYHYTNRWLKGILVIFGVVIIIKNVLEFLAVFQYASHDCKSAVHFIEPALQIVFIVTEVNFLFLHSKLCLQRKKVINRFGAMHVIATNLSVWMLTIIDESMREMSVEGTDSEDTSDEGSGNTHVVNNSIAGFQSRQHSETKYSSGEECICNTTYCDAVNSAHGFLYPFLIEFSLIASCMMYIMWKNIGRFPKHCHAIVKPVYKFYKSYKGLVIGIACLISTVVVLIALASIDSGVPEEEKDYESEVTSLIVHNSFLVTLEVLMITGCGLGLYLFAREPRPVITSINLDSALLLLTILGSVVMDVFYAFAVYMSLTQESYDYNWIWGAVYPLTDAIQCIIQVVFLLGGLARQPVLEETVNFTEFEGNEVANSYVNYVYEGSKENNDKEQEMSCSKTSEKPMRYSQCVSFSPATNVEEPETPEDSSGISVSVSGCTNRDSTEDGSDTLEIPDYQNNNLEEKSEITEKSNSATPRGVMTKKIAKPSRVRLYIRDVSMFLLLANGCMWIFWSLEGTAFDLYTYPYKYYSQNRFTNANTWQTISMICLPLSIFFRMHSCVCLFEIWSFS